MLIILLKKFNELDYDTQWVLLYFYSKKELFLNKKDKTVNSPDGPLLIWDYEPYFKDFCNATKRSMEIDDFEAKMQKLSDITDYLIGERILEQDGSQPLFKLSSKGFAYFELEIQNPLLNILPKINFGEKWEKFKSERDANNEYLFTYIICEHQDEKKTELLKNFKQIFQNITMLSLEKLSYFIMQDPDLTKNFIIFISTLLS